MKHFKIIDDLDTHYLLIECSFSDINAIAEKIFRKFADSSAVRVSPTPEEIIKFVKSIGFRAIKQDFDKEIKL
jgi:hypothetical protein